MQYKKKGIQKPMKPKNKNQSHGKKKDQHKDKFSKNGNFRFYKSTCSSIWGQNLTTTKGCPQKRRNHKNNQQKHSKNHNGKSPDRQVKIQFHQTWWSLIWSCIHFIFVLYLINWRMFISEQW